DQHKPVRGLDRVSSAPFLASDYVVHLHRPSSGPQTLSSSISGVTADPVSGTPSSLARLSAKASSRRIRPATASLVIGGSANCPNSSSDACRLANRSLPAASRRSE